MRSIRVALLGVAAAVLLFTTELVLRLGGDATVRVIDDTALFVAALAAAVPCWMAGSRRRGSQGLPWRLIALALLAWGAGEGVWGYYEVIAGVEVPFPSIADAAYLTAPLFAVVAMTALASPKGRASLGVRTLLDGGIVASSLLLVSWVFVLGPMFNEGGGFVPTAVSLAYPLSDVVLTAMALLLLTRVGLGARLPLAFVAGGMLCMAFADSAYGYLALRGAYETGLLADAAWFASYLLLGLAGLSARRDEPANNPRRFTRTAIAIPYIPVFVSLAIFARQAIGTRQMDGFVFWSGLVTILLVVGRQLLVLVENLNLNRELEAKVEARTRGVREREVRFRALSDSAQDAIVTADGRGTIVYANAAAERVLGYRPWELVGQPITVLFAQRRHDPRPGLDPSLVDAAVGAGSPFELVARKAGGSTCPVEVSIARYSIDGETFVTANIRDITERKDAENALRTAYERERESVERLEDADHLKDEFITLVSHELRTPLTSILGMGTLLADRSDALERHDKAELAHRIVVTTREMHGMVERLLDFSTLSQGLAAVDVRPVRVGDAIRACVKVLGPVMELHDVEVDVAPGLVALADSHAVRHVLGNLLGNATKYSEPGTTITVRARDDGERVLIEVSDEGPGVSEDLHERVFERFVQGPDQVPGRRGTGVGLTIVRDYVDRMGGRVWVEDRPERGATFCFTLPKPGTPAPTSSDAPEVRAGEHVTVA